MTSALIALRGLDGETEDVGAMTELVSMTATGELMLVFSTLSMSLAVLGNTTAVPPSSVGSLTNGSKGRESTSGSHWASVRRGSKYGGLSFRDGII